ncbi:MAG: four helix bundle protein [Verrucomicrobia bacterium 12-59-8]|nr:MAG: four helix bundle protein [Verrucomicrobia bacterium 12-59-8]
MQSYRDLIVWQKAMALVRQVYLITSEFPKHELFGLTSQLRRSAVSIPSNIAEGNGRSTTLDYIRFLQIARGSLFEAQTQIEIASQLLFLNPDQTQELLSLANEIERMLNSIITKLSR